MLVGTLIWAANRGVDVEKVNAESARQDPMQNAYILVPAITLMGILSLVMPRGQFRNGEFVVKNTIGMVRRSYQVGNLSKIYEKKGWLWIKREHGAKDEKIRMAKIWCHRGDWNKLLAAAQETEITKDLHDV